MEQEFDKEVPINNEFDYSNIVAEIQSLSYLVQYADTLYNQLMDMINKDEEKNMKLKIDFKYYEYKKSFDTKFEILVKEKGHSFNNLTLKSYESFMEEANKGNLNNVDSLTIVLNLSYRRGKEFDSKEYVNNFKFVFNPYDIKFIRNSNHDEVSMNQIESNFNEILKKFKVQNSIFSTK